MNICKTLDGLTEYEVRNANRSASIHVIPELGGIITSFTVNGDEVLYLDRELLSRQDIYAGGIPFLFPVCGDLFQDTFVYNGKEYPMPSHGFARNLPWEVIEDSLRMQGEIKLRLTYSKKTLEVYPFKFEVLLHYVLVDNSLVIHQTYINSGDDTMPFYSGFHPFFAAGEKSLLKFDINAQNYVDNTSNKTCDYTGLIDFNNAVDFVFPLEQTLPYICRMTDRDRYSIIEIQSALEFKTMVLWTETDKDFVCLEPWMACPNAMNTGKGLLSIPAGKNLQTWVKVLVNS